MESGTSVAQAARMCGASRATGYRWWARYRAEGWRGLHERPPIPHHQSDLIVSPAGGCDSDAHGVWLRGTDKLSYMCSDLAAAVELGPDGLGGIGG